jgi:D-3-phosphoglycerate dehydrogenase / 2-oxoglutarate reductase
MPFNVLRFDFWSDKIFEQTMLADSNVNYLFRKHADGDAENLKQFSSAHFYHICAARDEVPKQWHVTDALLAKANSLLCVTTSGAGYDPVDVEACTRHGVLVVNQGGCNADSVAEHALGLMLAVKHRITESDRVLRAGTSTNREALMGREIRGLCLGIVGFGHVGKRVARLARAFGMKLIACDPYVRSDVMEAEQVERVSFETLIAQSDIVTVHCPRNDETINLFNASTYAAMKPGAIFITTARGGIHNESELFTALTQGPLAGAGLDVWAVEPPSRENPLMGLDNVVATYHTAGVTHEARRNAARMAAEHIQMMMRGEKPLSVVNPEVWPTFLEKRLAAIA